MSFFEELKRRNVFRVGIAYAVAAWLLIQVTDIVFPRIGLPDSAVTLVIALLAIGFIPSLIFAWAFEMTPDGIKREKEVDRTQSITPKTGRKLDRMIIAVLALVIFSMAAERFWFAGKAEESASVTSTETVDVASSAKSIAVLPFADMSQNRDQEWFADGLAEEILNALARAPDLLVSSRTSSFAYKKTSTPISQIASELGVEHILEGSVRRAGDRIRVTAQLIRADDGFHVWSENYDRNVDDIIAIQEELAVSIAKALKTTMDPDALASMLQAGTRSVDAYEHYLNGLGLASRAGETARYEHLLESSEEFERAREIDPQFSEAHGRAAYFWRNQLSISRRGANQTDNSPTEIQALFRERIEQAIKTANNETDRKRHQLLEAAVDFRVREGTRLAIELIEERPYDFEVLNHLSDFAIWGSDSEAENILLDRAYELWENGAQWAELYITTAWRGTQPRQIADFVPRAITRYPNNKGLIYQSHRALLWQGENELAGKLAGKLRNERPDARAIIDVRQACAEGRRTDAERILKNLDSAMSPGNVASTKWHLLQILGRHDEAHAQLKSWESAEAPLPVAAYLIYPDFDPSYFEIVQSLIQRESIHRSPPREIPFACPDEDLIQQESVAVLPFVAMSNGEDDGYFADGLTEEILNALTALPELLVTARTSSFHFKGKDIPVPEIAATLGVDHVVEGSVRRSGERVRITAQLIRADDGFHLWSDTYDRTLEDVFKVQEEIAENIAETLDVVLSEEKRQKMRKAGIKNVEAFIAYQKGMAAFEQAHSLHESIPQLVIANQWFDIALDKVPELPDVYYLHQDLYGHKLFDYLMYSNSDYKTQDVGDALKHIQNDLDRAIRYARTDAERAIFSAERVMLSEDWSRMGEWLDQAFKPGDCTPLNWVQNVANVFGWASQATQQNQNIMRCDPLSSLPRWQLPHNLLWAGDAEAAVASAEQSLKIYGFDGWTDDSRFSAQLALDPFADDAQLLSPNPENSNFDQPRKLFTLAARGETEAAISVFDDWFADNQGDDLALLLLAAMTGQRDLANETARLIDDRFLGSFGIMLAVSNCLCGAPFDLDATPNFKKRVEEAGFHWPPPSPIKFPAKDW